VSTRYYPPEPEDERSLGELFSELTQELQALLRKEVELAKTELQEQASRAAKGVAMFAAAAVMGFLAIVLLSFAVAWGLAEVVPTGFAFLAVGVLYLAVAGLLAMLGRKRLASVEPPTQTLQTLQEDVQTAKSSLSRGMTDDRPSVNYPGRRS